MAVRPCTTHRLPKNRAFQQPAKIAYTVIDAERKGADHAL